ncbi:MAG: hypothetical protein ACOYBJ_01730 [Patescibacteria group bacterium]|jgi:hypothetical protein
MPITLPNIQSCKDIPSLEGSLRAAIDQLHGVRKATLAGPSALTGFQLRQEVESLFRLHSVIQSRVQASGVLGNDELVRDRFLADLDAMLAGATAVLDELRSTKPTNPESVDTNRAAAQYEQRAQVWQQFASGYTLLTGVDVPRDNEENSSATTGEKRDDERWVPLLNLSKKSATELTAIITRAIPVDPQLDYDVSALIAPLLLGADKEPAVLAIAPAGAQLSRTVLSYKPVLDSQEFRDYIAATLAPLLHDLLSNEEPQAYDKSYRNCYFTVVQYLMKYYREHGEELKAEAATMAAAQAQPAAQPVTPAQDAPDAPRDVLAPAEAPVAQPGGETLLDLAQGPQTNGAVAVNGQPPAAQPAPTPTEPTPATPPTNPEQPGQPIPVQTQTRKVKPIDVS